MIEHDRMRKKLRDAMNASIAARASFAPSNTQFFPIDQAVKWGIV